jgi:DNA-binding MarR family transcriptional regulator
VNDPDDIRQQDYATLLGFRTTLRRFLHWSESEAAAAGLTPSQHQLLLAIRGHPHPSGPTIGDISDYLVLRHHSVVELVDRASSAGLVVRKGDQDDHRVVRLRLTREGARRIARLSRLHLEELRRLAPLLPLPGDAGEEKGPPPRR